MSKSNSQAQNASDKALAKSDAWLSKNETTIVAAHKSVLDFEEKLLEATAKLQHELYESRKETLSKIPHFWHSVILKAPQTALFVQLAEDQHALTFLNDISIKRGPDYSKDSRDFELTFTFGENPYFSNKTLVKKHTTKPASHEGHDHSADDGPTDHDDEPSSEPITIDWKDNAHNLSKLFPRNVTGGEDEDDIDGVEPGSFFSYFTAPNDDFSMGMIFRDDILPQAVEIYAGLVEDSDDSEGGMDEFDEESDDEPEPNPRPTKKSKN